MFDMLAGCRAAGPDLAARPVRQWCSDAQVLSPGTPVTVSCVPLEYQRLSGQWHDQDTARGLDTLLFQREMERAVRSPDVTPPYGCCRDIPPRPGRWVVMAARRARDYLLGDLPPVFPPAGYRFLEDSTPTEEFPVVQEVRSP